MTGTIREGHVAANDREPQKIAFVIFAQNESSVIEKTINNVTRILRESDELYVVADNSSDDTAATARKAGAKVVIRNSGSAQGKGAALTWFMNKFRLQIIAYDSVIILDADSLIPVDFIDKLCLHSVHELMAAQCFLSPVGFKDSPLTTLIALSEIVEQTFFDRIRTSLHLSVRLRGTGMVFDPQLLLRLCPQIDTEVEDIALSLLAAEQKITIRLLPEVVVFDPKPADRAAAARQRARWYRGQWTAFWKYRATIFKLLVRGPKGWAVLSSLFLKPRWLKLVVLLALGFVFLWQPVVAAILFALTGLELLLILTGILLLPERGLFIKSLVYIPAFILMWIKGIFLSLKRRPWLRVREEPENENLHSESRPAIDPTDSHSN